jgi:hypothetical protein
MPQPVENLAVVLVEEGEARRLHEDRAVVVDAAVVDEDTQADRVAGAVAFGQLDRAQPMLPSASSRNLSL